MTTSKSIATFIVALFASLIIFPMSAHAAQLAPASFNLPPNATQIVKYKDGNSYALYKGKVCALTKVNSKAKTIVVPKAIKIKGKTYKVTAIHELNLKNVKKVTIKANKLETVEEPMLFKSWRTSHHKTLKVKITDKAIRKWLNEKW